MEIALTVFATLVLVIVAAAVFPQVSMFFERVRDVTMCIYHCVKES